MEQGTTIALLCMDKPRALGLTIESLKVTLVHPYEVIVIDNGSTDPATLDILSKVENLPDWRVIHNEENLGLSIGTNQGLEQGKFDCLIHLDDDCIINLRGWNQVLRSYFEIPEVGMVVPAQSPLSIRHERYQELLWALGMCWAIRKELFDDIGGYDPQLLHQNECDMALRVRMAGYHLAGINDFHAIHNDPGGPKSEFAYLREEIGTIQFRDKWCSYFRGRHWKYGTDPIYLMEHWPPDQEFLQRFAVQEGLMLNPIPEGMAAMPDHLDAEGWKKVDALAGQQKIPVNGVEFLIFRELRRDYHHWEWLSNPGAHDRSAQVRFDQWLELTGEPYPGYVWKQNLLRPY